MGTKINLYLVIPCYNEEKVLPDTVPQFLDKLKDLKEREIITPSSRLVLVNDGSKDETWEMIAGWCQEEKTCLGISLSRNRGHQKALLAGLMEVRGCCDVAISMDCDGQDDLEAVDDMLEAYGKGADIVYGVRRNRDSDSFWKRHTAQWYYDFQRLMGVKAVNNHGDFRLLSRKVLDALAEYKEVNVYLRGMVPLVGYHSTCVYYERKRRKEGKTHYSIHNMFSLALDGITSMTTRPLHLIMLCGLAIASISFLGVIWSVVIACLGRSVRGWASLTCILCFLSGIQLLSIGVIGEYIGKIYLETKKRPRYIVSERVGEWKKEKDS